MASIKIVIWTNFWAWIIFIHVLLIKDNSIFINHLQWYWTRHYIFFIRLIIIKVFYFFIFFIVTGFLLTAASSVLYAFFHQSQEEEEEEEEEREWMLIQCRKLRSKVKESFVNLFRQCRYIYIYIYIYIIYIYIYIDR